MKGDLSAQMVEGISKFLLREIESAGTNRAQFWQPEFSSREAYENSIASNRERLRKMIGVVDSRLPVTGLEFIETTLEPSLVAETDLYTIRAVRWPVLEGVHGEGLLLQPKGVINARIVVLPDADQTPEMICGLTAGVAPASQLPRRLAEHGCQVLVPVLIDRKDTWSGNQALGRFTDLPHREWICQAFELGRHLIGYEVQKALAAIDWFSAESAKAGLQGARCGRGVCRGRNSCAPRRRAGSSHRCRAGQRLLRPPRWSLVGTNLPKRLRAASRIRRRGDRQPRCATFTIIEHSEAPTIDGPPKAQSGRSGAAHRANGARRISTPWTTR